MIVGAIRVAMVADIARRVRERIPDRAPSPVFIDGAFDLIRGGGGTPHKAVRKPAGGMWLGSRIGLALLCAHRHSRCSESGQSRQLRKMPPREPAEHGFLRSDFLTSAFGIERFENAGVHLLRPMCLAVPEVSA